VVARSPAGESVLQRAARLLESFEHDRQVLTVAQLARRTDLPVPTAHRLVAQLVDVGFLERAGRSGVHVGIRLWEIAASAPRAVDLREAAMPFLEDVQAATRQHTAIYVLDGLDVLVIERLRSRGAVSGVLLKAGRRIPAHALASGHVLLAHADEETQQRVLAARLRRYNERTPTEPKQMRALWESARERGFLVCEGFVHREATSIAVPVRDSADEVIAALSVVVPRETTDPRSYVSVLLAAAHGIRRVLSGPPVRGRTRNLSYLPDATRLP
jgi:DNA-binding IclR family transcriptional regulator